MRRTSVFLLVASLAFFALPSSGTAQSPRRPQSPLQTASRALVEGRYDEVDTLTDKLDPRDPNVVALKARAEIARGRYAQAEASARVRNPARPPYFNLPFPVGMDVAFDEHVEFVQAVAGVGDVMR